MKGVQNGGLIKIKWWCMPLEIRHWCLFQTAMCPSMLTCASYTNVGHYSIVCLYGEVSGLYGGSTYKLKDAKTVKYAYTVKDA